MEKIPMTPTGAAALERELGQLKSKERPAIIRAIAEAREHGDLSENAEYHAAREKQGFVEGRIKELESLLSRAEVIDPATGEAFRLRFNDGHLDDKLNGIHLNAARSIDNSVISRIKFGARVKLIDEDTEEERNYQIVGEAEADIERGLLNIRSPLARALIGKEEGDSVEVTTPGGQRSYEIVEIRYG